MEKQKNKSLKKRDLINLLVGVLIILLVNYISTKAFYRLDLTTEKRYSLSNASKDLVKNLDDVVFVKVYLDGDLPAGFKRLQDATKEMLDELRAYSGDKVEYEFINPSESPDEKTRNEVYQILSKKGLQYTNLEYKDGDKVAEKIIFPGALVTYKGRELPLQLLKSQLGADPEVMLNNSIQQLEYELASTIIKLVKEKRESIAFIEGHGEYDELDVADITNALNEFYTVSRVKIEGKLSALDELDAIIIAGPTSAFEEKDKFIIDQFIMRGGKVLWFIDQVFASMDSLSVSPTTVGMPQSLNLDDQLFRYGIRINTDLVLDLQSLPIPIVTGYIGNQPKQEFYPWFYFPLLMANGEHPIVKNIDAVKTEFISSIDTIERKGIRKTILLTTSPYTKLVSTPTRISLNLLRQTPDQRQYNKPHQAVAVLLEGKFESVFVNRVPPEIANSKEIGFKQGSEETKMMVVSDGDIIKNRTNKSKQEFFPLGFDRFTNRQYGNKELVMNMANYLFDDSGLIDSRTKEFKIRLLDVKKIENERLKWQLINLLTPIASILLLGLIIGWWRKKKYA